jgi:uncharacterized protein (TIGR02646 family)
LTTNRARSTNKVTKKANYDGYLVVRSSVGSVNHYREYRQPLRKDFTYSCAYCTITEAEAGGINFAIDHYRPKISNSDLVNSYDNLMYCCSECNSRKGDRDPPDAARNAGLRFFRPDKDARPEHFSIEGLSLTGSTSVGDFSVQAIDLNRAHLRRLRDIRKRHAACDEYVANGIAALLNLRIDQLRPEARSRALKARDRLVELVGRSKEDLDELLRESARSGLLDPDPEAEDRFKERAAKLQDYESLYPGRWRGRDI